MKSFFKKKNSPYVCYGHFIVSYQEAHRSGSNFHISCFSKLIVDCWNRYNFLFIHIRWLCCHFLISQSKGKEISAPQLNSHVLNVLKIPVAHQLKIAGLEVCNMWFFIKFIPGFIFQNHLCSFLFSSPFTHVYLIYYIFHAIRCIPPNLVTFTLVKYYVIYVIKYFTTFFPSNFFSVFSSSKT